MFDVIKISHIFPALMGRKIVHKALTKTNQFCHCRFDAPHLLQHFRQRTGGIILLIFFDFLFQGIPAVLDGRSYPFLYFRISRLPADGSIMKIIKSLIEACGIRKDQQILICLQIMLQSFRIEDRSLRLHA